MKVVKIKASNTLGVVIGTCIKDGIRHYIVKSSDLELTFVRAVTKDEIEEFKEIG